MTADQCSEKELAQFYAKIGANVKRLRKERGITQLDLALSIGHSSVGHIAKAELNKYGKHFNLEQLYKIALTLNIKPSELLE